MKASRQPRRADDFSTNPASAPSADPANPYAFPRPAAAPAPSRFVGAGDSVASAPNEVNGPDALRFERRREPRTHATGLMAATYSNGKDRYGIAQFHLLDRSAEGLGALTTTYIEPGMAIALSPVGSNVAWLTGRATRCDREGDQFRIGIALTAPKLAA